MNLIFTSIILTLSPTLALTDSPSLLIKQVVTENIRATQAEDVDAVMVTMHSKSPNWAATKTQLPALFERFELKYELIKYEFVSVSGEYAIARVKQNTTAEKDAGFRNNTIDSFMVFKKDNGKWTIWAQTILEIKFD